mmetsp:Transcript_95151/g.308098  ORF Transcript_95151/g.308098 Transcript_95151/m.308098 type:complete len:408 (-) Transcript_95151:262-1485(-)
MKNAPRPSPAACRSLQVQAPFCASTGVTTVLFRYVPRCFSTDDVISALEKRIWRKAFDFVYVPWSPFPKANMGYAFVNFVNPAFASTAMELFDKTSWKISSASQAPMQVGPPHVQSFSANMLLCIGCKRPRVFHQGEEIAFELAMDMLNARGEAMSKECRRQSLADWQQGWQQLIDNKGESVVGKLTRILADDVTQHCKSLSRSTISGNSVAFAQHGKSCSGATISGTAADFTQHRNSVSGSTISGYSGDDDTSDFVSSRASGKLARKHLRRDCGGLTRADRRLTHCRACGESIVSSREEPSAHGCRTFSRDLFQPARANRVDFHQNLHTQAGVAACTARNQEALASSCCAAEDIFAWGWDEKDRANACHLADGSEGDVLPEMLPGFARSVDEVQNLLIQLKNLRLF